MKVILSFALVLVVSILFSCKETSNKMESKSSCNSCSSLNINQIIGKEYGVISLLISEGKILLQACRNDNGKNSDEEKKGYIFIIDIATKKIIYQGLNPTYDYIGYSLAIDGETLIVTHALHPNEVFKINIKTKKATSLLMNFNQTANSPGMIMLNGNQLFMIQNIYGFALADLNTLTGKVFSTHTLGDNRSTISLPVDSFLNLLSGELTKDNSVTLYGIDRNSHIKWKKVIMPNARVSDDIDGFRIFKFEDRFIIKYNNVLEAWSKTSGDLLWKNIQKAPIGDIYMQNGRLILYTLVNGSKMLLSNKEDHNKKVTNSYVEYIKSIDARTGEEIWHKEFNGAEHEYGIFKDNLILRSNSSTLCISLNSGNINNNETLNLPDKRMKTLIDSKTGHLYLEIDNVIYW